MAYIACRVLGGSICLRILFFPVAGAWLLYGKTAFGVGHPCIAGAQTRKKKAIHFRHFRVMIIRVLCNYLVSVREDSNDGELSSSSGDHEDSSHTNSANARQ